ncbi:MAG: metallophosphoesterase family protein [Promethearchaeota archaeon]|nr:MAG: metallophosphoesterase family protein [Candidatus Lokiarchaeota archaeon]
MIDSSYSSKSKKIVIIGLFSLLLIISSIYYVIILSEDNFNSTSDDDDSNSLEVPPLVGNVPKGIRLTFIYNYNDSIVVSWYTEKNATNPKVVYSINANLFPSNVVKPNSTQMSTSIFLYFAEIIHLQPNTTYYYQVSSDENNKREIMNFTTLPNEDASNVTFLVYGDSRTQRLERNLLAKQIMESFRNQFEFTIHTGDIVEDGRDQNRWNNYFEDTELLNAFKQGVYAEGNHEGGLSTKMYDNLPMYSTENKRYYYFSYGEIGFIILNSNNELDYTYNDAQTNWLNNTLFQISQKNTINFAFLHHPLLHNRSYDYHRAHWKPLFDKYNVSIIFCGHNHHYERSYPLLNSTTLEFDDSEHYKYNNLNDTIYIVTGGAGAPLRDVYSYDFIAETTKAYHFLLVDVKKDPTKIIIKLESWAMINEHNPLQLIDNITLTKFL